MLDYKIDFFVENLSGQQITDFMVACDDKSYRQWWPGVHLAFHTTKAFSGNVGNLVLFDEYIGKRRLKFEAVLETYKPAEAMVWKMKKIVPLPARLAISMRDVPGGVNIRHALLIGCGKRRNVLDKIVAFFIPRGLEKDLATHSQIEFGELRRLLENRTNDPHQSRDFGK